MGIKYYKGNDNNRHKLDDYAIKVWINGRVISYLLVKAVNIDDFLSHLKSGHKDRSSYIQRFIIKRLCNAIGFQYYQT